MRFAQGDGANHPSTSLRVTRSGTIVRPSPFVLRLRSLRSLSLRMTKLELALLGMTKLARASLRMTMVRRLGF
jgi:hypothetical protein